MTDLESPAASAVESPEDFVRLVFADDGIPEYEVEHSNLGRNLVDGIRSRDRVVRREALAPFAWAIAEAFRCEKDIEIRVGSLTTVVTAADVRLALATGGSDVR